MGNIVMSIKRFLQNKNTVTILALLASVGVIYFAYNYRIKKSTEPVNVPYAVNEIGPWTEITSEMVSIKKVPGGVVTKDVITTTGNIVGKYVRPDAVIPEGSMFYNSTVVPWDELPKSAFEKIEDNQRIYYLTVSMESTYGNSIYPGNYIDIYYKTTNGGKIWIGKFIEGIRVLDVLDSSNRSVFETNGTPRTPAKLAFNLDEDYFTLFNKVYGVGQITLFPVQRNASYSKNAENKQMKIVGTEFKQFVLDRSVDDSIVNPNSKKGGNK